MLFGVGRVVRTHNANGFDLIDFEFTHGPGTNTPVSFGGVSGGGLWRVFPSGDDDGRYSSIEPVELRGVVFYQTDETNGRGGIISCHGPQGIYGRLVDDIRQTWPQ